MPLIETVPLGETVDKPVAGELDRSRMPRHIGIIMDGNGRWARRRGFPRVEGHRRGERTVKEIVRACGELGIEYLTLYTFSAENWRRPEDEVRALMGLLEIVARREIQELHRSGVRLRVLGRVHDLPPNLQQLLIHGVELTRENKGLTLSLALNYGGRAEIVDAARKLASKVARGILQPEDINEESLARELYAPDMPDPDLVIRTGGEVRLSNFLLWQAAYSEIWVTDVLWPDFGRAELAEGIRSFQSRERRFGGVN